MGFIGGLIEIGIEHEWTMTSRYFSHTGAFDQLLVFAAIVNQIGDSADFQSMLCGEVDQIR